MAAAGSPCTFLGQLHQFLVQWHFFGNAEYHLFDKAEDAIVHKEAIHWQIRVRTELEY